MPKKNIFISLSVLLAIGLIAGVFQYIQTLKADLASAVTVGTPNPGHTWAQMECNANSLCIDTVNKRVGIGTANPSKKLEVNGDGLFVGDVCNGGGKCLSSVFQTNVISGTNPTCPAGQTAIMRAYNGTWYTASQVSSWSQVACGQVLSSDGTALLVNSQHTSKNCTDAGGTVIGDGAGNNMCRFSNKQYCTDVDATWQQYQGWSAVTANYCDINPDHVFACGCSTSCSTSAGHSWANDGTLPTCAYQYSYNTGNGCSCGALTCSSTRTLIGCY
jgi:hypothetical protein